MDYSAVVLQNNIPVKPDLNEDFQTQRQTLKNEFKKLFEESLKKLVNDRESIERELASMKDEQHPLFYIGACVMTVVTPISAFVFGKNISLFAKSFHHYVKESNSAVKLARRIQLYALARNNAKEFVFVAFGVAITAFCCWTLATYKSRRTKLLEAYQENANREHYMRYVRFAESEEANISLIRISPQDVKYGRLFLEALVKEEWKKDREALKIEDKDNFSISEKYKTIQLKSHPDKRNGDKTFEKLPQKWQEFKEIDEFYTNVDSMQQKDKYKIIPISLEDNPKVLNVWNSCLGGKFPLRITDDIEFPIELSFEEKQEQFRKDREKIFKTNLRTHQGASKPEKKE